MPRFFTTWATAFLLMSAGISEMWAQLPHPSDRATAEVHIQAEPMGDATYQIRVGECVETAQRTVSSTELPLRLHTHTSVPCLIEARRRDGALWTPWTRERASGELTLDGLPEARWGGIGVSFRPTPLGALILEVHRGYPGAAMGLEPGDVLVRVDGRPLGGHDEAEMIGMITGPEGTEIALGIIDVRTGNTLTRRSTRRFIDQRS